MGINDREIEMIRIVSMPETATTRPMAFIETNADPKTKKFTDKN